MWRILLESGTGRGHSVSDQECPVAPQATSPTTLLKIAQTLGCSVKDFSSEGGLPIHESGIELMSLWAKLPDDASRLRLLAVARSLAK